MIEGFVEKNKDELSPDILALLEVSVLSLARWASAYLLGSLFRSTLVSTSWLSLRGKTLRGRKTLLPEQQDFLVSLSTPDSRNGPGDEKLSLFCPAGLGGGRALTSPRIPKPFHET